MYEQRNLYDAIINFKQGKNLTTFELGVALNMSPFHVWNYKKIRQIDQQRGHDKITVTNRCPVDHKKNASCKRVIHKKTTAIYECR